MSRDEGGFFDGKCIKRYFWRARPLNRERYDHKIGERNRGEVGGIQHSIVEIARTF